MNRPTSTLVLGLVAVLGLARGASGQFTPALDGLWFRLDVKAKGQAVAPDLQAEPERITTTAYLLLQPGELPGGGAPTDDVGAPGPIYDWQIWTEQDGGWAASSSGTIATVSTAQGDQLFVDMAFALHLEGGIFVEARGTFRFHVTTDAQDAVKSVRIGTLGAECTNGSADGEGFFVGGLTLKGRLVDAAKLPFTPSA